MKLVGLTGGIACGKSEASRFLKKLGFPVIDCDSIAFEVVKKGHWGFNRVVGEFQGQDIFREDGEIDRKKLGDIIFSNPDARKKLNRATHLPVLFEILRQAAWYWITLRPVVMVDMPLLFETGFYHVCQENVLIRCSPTVQLRRLQSRDGLGVEEAQSRINAQMPLESKVRLATMVVDNDNDSDGMESLRKRIEEVGSVLLRQAWLHRIAFSPIGVALFVTGLFHFSHFFR